MTSCRACGAQNAADARFCNMCGARVAGDAAASLPAAASSAPSTTTTMGGSRISLEAIGVRSARGTWAVLLGGGLLLFLLGAGGAWIALRSSSAPGGAAGDADAGIAVAVSEPIEVGDPVPAEESPEGVDIVTSGPRRRSADAPVRTRAQGGTREAASGGSGRSGATGGSAGAGAAAGGSAGGSGGGGSAGGSGGGGSAGGSGGGGGGSGGSGGGAEAGAGSTTGGAEAGAGSAGGAGGTAASGRSGSPDWAALEAADDYAMDQYGAHVRRVIREFYVRRAQSCFDHETRVDQEPVRGTIVIGFTIEESGEVTHTSVDRNTTGRDALGACLARQVDQWRLPPPPEGEGAQQMQMPFSR